MRNWQGASSRIYKVLVVVNNNSDEITQERVMYSYTKDFYKELQEGSKRSAKVIVPFVIELIRPASVVDVGCGLGTWLSVFKEHCITDILGIDGDLIDKEMLEIPKPQFLAVDLQKPFNVNRKFDLVISLEVAEHLPVTSAEIFIDSLVKLGPIVLFSAAFPFQGGTHHINEQWPDYWAKRFLERGYKVLDVIREKIWQNENVDWWYAQNTLMFVEQDYLKNHPVLERKSFRKSPSQLSIVHPKMYLQMVEKYEKLVKGSSKKDMSLKEIIRALITNTFKKVFLNPHAKC